MKKTIIIIAIAIVLIVAGLFVYAKVVERNAREAYQATDEHSQTQDIIDHAEDIIDDHEDKNRWGE